MTSARPEPAPREAFAWFYGLDTRWADNDIYGHINNVAYYSYFDTVVNRYLIEEGGLRPLEDSVVGYVVNSGCDYFAPIAHPAELDFGLRVTRLGTKSVAWEIGVFMSGEARSRVTGRFTHAFVDRRSNAAVAIPEPLRSAIERLL